MLWPAGLDLRAAAAATGDTARKTRKASSTFLNCSENYNPHVFSWRHSVCDVFAVCECVVVADGRVSGRGQERRSRDQPAAAIRPLIRSLPLIDMLSRALSRSLLPRVAAANIHKGAVSAMAARAWQKGERQQRADRQSAAAPSRSSPAQLHCCRAIRGAIAPATHCHVCLHA